MSIKVYYETGALEFRKDSGLERGSARHEPVPITRPKQN